VFPAPAIRRTGYPEARSYDPHRGRRSVDPGRQFAIGHGPQQGEFFVRPGPAADVSTARAQSEFLRGAAAPLDLPVV
jgi:hypothetical protein